MKMGRQRNTLYSIFYALYEALADSRTKDKGQTQDFLTYKFSEDDWLWSTPVNIYINGTPVESGFRVDYRKGQVIFDTPQDPNAVVEADYSYCFVKLHPDFPVATEDDYVGIELPAVSIEHVSKGASGGELGSQLARVIEHRFEITVWAQRAGQRDDISEMIENCLWKGIYLVDFNQGYPILQDGSKNPNYDKIAQSIGFLEFTNVIIRPMGVEQFGEEYGEVKRYVTLIEAWCEDPLF